MKDFLIIIPAYNEQERIGAVLDALTVPEIGAWADVLVMNDASSDDTGRVVRSAYLAASCQIVPSDLCSVANFFQASKSQFTGVLATLIRAQVIAFPSSLSSFETLTVLLISFFLYVL